MSSSTILPRAPRLNPAVIARAEADQTKTIDELRVLGDNDLADRLQRCQDARRQRQPGAWPWRCRSVACWACRRATIRRWWRGFLRWLGPGQDVSLVTIELPATTDLIATMRRTRKGLRDVRDRANRADPVFGWSALAMAGIVSDDHLMLIVQHDGIARNALWAMFERRWPQVSVRPVEMIEPRCDFRVAQIVQLARQRRGIEPVRVVVPAQVRANDQDDGWNEAMPMTF